MANTYFPSQFIYSKTRALSLIQGQINIVQEVKATLVSQGVTYTAAAFGSGGNSISIQITPGATAGSEVVTVVGNAISIQVETGVSTVTQVRSAVNSSIAAAALVAATGTSSATVATHALQHLAGGIDGVSSSTILGASVAQTGVGEYTVTLAESYNALMACHLNVQAATAVDLVPQIKSNDVLSAKTIVFRLLAGATATDPSAALVVHFSAFLRNSSVVY